MDSVETLPINHQRSFAATSKPSITYNLITVKQPEKEQLTLFQSTFQGKLPGNSPAGQAVPHLPDNQSVAHHKNGVTVYSKTSVSPANRNREQMQTVYQYPQSIKKTISSLHSQPKNDGKLIVQVIRRKPTEIAPN